MSINTGKYKSLLSELKDRVTLIAVSKTKPIEDILALYGLGQRDFGENYVQEMVDKEASLPKDIRWHFIGHLQSNKIKYIAPFVHLIHGVDSWPLLNEINKQGMKNNRVINCLLQVHIAKEETKFGLNETELSQLNDPARIVLNERNNVQVTGLMGMASFTDDTDLIRAEFIYLKSLFDQYPQFRLLSMGMSADYTIALEEGSNMVRIGSLLFGERNYSK